MTEESVDDFSSMFKGPPGADQREKRIARETAERRTQQTDAQRKRGAVRTTQINFRCSPAFRDLAKGMSEHLDVSTADVMERALELLAKKTNYKGGRP